ncbi:hypothetical protein PSPO01_03640 [Paraphaeosphaeria sporulosa]
MCAVSKIPAHGTLHIGEDASVAWHYTCQQAQHFIQEVPIRTGSSKSIPAAVLKLDSLTSGEGYAFGRTVPNATISATDNLGELCAPAGNDILAPKAAQRALHLTVYRPTREGICILHAAADHPRGSKHRDGDIFEHPALRDNSLGPARGFAYVPKVETTGRWCITWDEVAQKRSIAPSLMSRRTCVTKNNSHLNAAGVHSLRDTAPTNKRAIRSRNRHAVLRSVCGLPLLSAPACAALTDVASKDANRWKHRLGASTILLFLAAWQDAAPQRAPTAP